MARNATIGRLAPLFMLFLLSQCVSGAALRAPDLSQGAHAFTWDQEFDYITWTLDTAALKLGQAALGAENYLDEEAQSEVVRQYMALVSEIQGSEGQLSVLHADPNPSAVT